jgi:hypothetical protein
MSCSPSSFLETVVVGYRLPSLSMHGYRRAGRLTVTGLGTDDLQARWSAASGSPEQTAMLIEMTRSRDLVGLGA